MNLSVEGRLILTHTNFFVNNSHREIVIITWSHHCKLILRNNTAPTKQTRLYKLSCNVT